MTKKGGDCCGEDIEQLVRDECTKSLGRLSMESKIFRDKEGREKSFSSIKEVAKNDIEKGDILGTGGFSHIRAIATARRGSMFHIDETNETLIKSSNRSTMNESSSEQSDSALQRRKSGALQSQVSDYSLDLSFPSGKTLNSSLTSGSKLDSSFTSSKNLILSKDNFAVKCIRRSIDPCKMYHGTIDLAKEAKFLSALSHDHIIGIHSVADSESVGTVDYFIILERIKICLTKQFKLWEAKVLSIKYARLPRKKVIENNKRQLDNRLVSMYQVSLGLAYMHEKNILFRDLKPDNIGISFTGQAKIFDFGLATELKQQDKVAEDKYRATQMCGTRRYMAREVYFGEPYGLPADVHSFALVLWETTTLEIPYHGMTLDGLIWYTYKLKRRPKVRMKWPKDLKRWIKRGWCHKPESRMKMESICSEMRQYFTRKDIQIVSSKIN